MIFANPSLLWLLLILIPCIIWYILNHRKLHAPIAMSATDALAKLPVSYKIYLLHAMFGLRMILIATLILILARPQIRDKWSTSTTEGTDIIVALDISTSMLARDFKPDRFEAAKSVASQFVSGRENDNIGLVIFAGESFTAVPLTNDRAMLANYINDVRMGMLQDNTAIGDGLATSINRIKEGKAKSKSIILLTDGSNNTGNVAPITAAEIAKKLGIKVYTIGIGRNGNAPYPAENAFGRIEYVNMPVVIDEATLKTVASVTGGKYFRATDKRVLQNIFDEIDKLEKSQIDVRNFSHTEDDYLHWALLALCLLAAELIIRHTWLRAIP